MADKINGYGRNGVDITSTRARALARTERTGEQGKTGSASASSSSGELKLTDTAANLKQIEARLADVPDVDRKRVDAVRQRVENGSYEVNAGRLADRLLAFERDLA